MNAKRMLVWVWLLLAPALGGSLGYGFLGFQGAWQGGGGGFGTFQGVALGGESWGGPRGYGGSSSRGPGFPWAPGSSSSPPWAWAEKAEASSWTSGCGASGSSGRKGAGPLGWAPGTPCPWGLPGAGGTCAWPWGR